MAKNQRNKIQKTHKVFKDKGQSHQKSAAKVPTKAPPKQAQPPTIPFSQEDRILLIGEGDLSFAHSLISHHGCYEVTSTVFDGESELKDKYPQASENAKVIVEEYDQIVLYGVDATKLKQKELHKGQGWDRVIFNFPHVGGKSTDVNRQVRYNQEEEMLVSFFQAATPLLSATGTIIVTLFEGEPYTLWNIRDLARHSGLEVERSFKFQASAYPGYSHARTLGNIGGGGGWKGEDRAARSYIFRKKAEAISSGTGSAKKRKRGKGEDSSDDDD